MAKSLSYLSRQMVELRINLPQSMVVFVPIGELNADDDPA